MIFVWRRVVRSASTSSFHPVARVIQQACRLLRLAARLRNRFSATSPSASVHRCESSFPARRVLPVLIAASAECCSLKLPLWLVSSCSVDEAEDRRPVPIRQLCDREHSPVWCSSLRTFLVRSMPGASAPTALDIASASSLRYMGRRASTATHFRTLYLVFYPKSTSHRTVDGSPQQAGRQQ
ncbi:Uncharacterized protein PBTT_00681 [Plasmodiophora brassicae]